MSKKSYVMSSRIAQGGMAEIYLGKEVGDDSFQRIVAIKRILPHYAANSEFVEMFRDEAHICKRLQHVNIVQVYNFDEVNGSYALIMEHVDGADFRTLLSSCENANRRLDIPMVLHIILQTARGLHYAHTKQDEVTQKPLGIVHRDVSPQNILISYEGEVKITDFGIASADNKVSDTRPGVVKGKYSYMSPEQVSAKHLDGRTDVFSLAIVLWEALAMSRLFASDTEVETIRKVQNCDIPNNLLEKNSEVTTDLNEIVMRGLAKDTKQRYQSAADFERAISKYLHSRYPDFLPSQLGDFLKQLLAAKWDKSREAQAQVLTNSESSIPKPIHSVSHLRSSKEIKSSGGQSTASHQGSHSIISPIELMKPAQVGYLGNTALKNGSYAQTANNSYHGRLGNAPEAQNSFQPTVKKVWNPVRPLALLLVAVVALAAFHFRHKFMGDPVVLINLKSNIEEVRVYIDGKNIYASQDLEGKSRNDRYASMPKQIAYYLDQKNHQIDIKRPGFLSKSIIFDTKEAKELNFDINLERDPKVNLTTLNIVSNTPVAFDLDNGMKKGETPLRVVNVATGLTHKAYVKSNLSPQRLPCTFRILNTVGTEVTLEITASANLVKCAIKGQR